MYYETTMGALELIRLLHRLLEPMSMFKNTLSPRNHSSLVTLTLNICAGR